MTALACTEIQASLPAYCLSAIDDAERAAVERHLPGCAACVGELVALKRALDLAEDAPRPPSALGARVRAAVAAELSPRPRRWWHRPAALAVAAAISLCALGAMNALTSGPGAPPRSAASSTAATVPH